MLLGTGCAAPARAREVPLGNWRLPWKVIPYRIKEGQVELLLEDEK